MNLKVGALAIMSKSICTVFATDVGVEVWFMYLRFSVLHCVCKKERNEKIVKY